MLFNSNKVKLLFLSLLTSFSLAIYANPNAEQPQFVIAPDCLLQKDRTKTIHYQILSRFSSFVLLKTNEYGMEQLATIKHKPSAKACGGFINVTEDWLATQNKSHANGIALIKKNISTPPIIKKSDKEKPYAINYPDQVNNLIKQINASLIWNDLTEFSNTAQTHFPDRSSNSNTGVKAANWLKSKVENLIEENHRKDISIYTVATGSYKQPSVVVKVGVGNEPAIVLGAHMDTLSINSYPDIGGLKPGADDDGSGSMTLMSVARTLINSGMQFKKPIYFVWYAAEEIGLVGSKYVVRDFVQKQIPVSAVLQLDMTGYAYQNEPTIWLSTDNVNKSLTSYMETLIKTYVKQPFDHTECGYACSDHASWHRAGFVAAFPMEGKMYRDNPYIHTSRDTIEKLSLDHMADFAKLGVAFAVELAQPV